MSESGINSKAFYMVSRIKTTFRDDLGNPKSGTGTGFWISDNQEKHSFATNRHNLDPTLKFGDITPYKLDSVAIELRKRAGDRVFPDTKFFSVTNANAIHHADADCSILRDVQFEDTDISYGYYPFPVKDLADKVFFDKVAWPLDEVTFIGFPQDWYDTEWVLPIGRNATIACEPSRSFSNPAIKTSDTLLVSGFSFNGSSGSPVFLHHQLFDTNQRTKRPAKLVGIMSGHAREQVGDEPPMFRHSGLSYFTRSTSILDLFPSTAIHENEGNGS
jgi:hypothetical protein